MTLGLVLFLWFKFSAVLEIFAPSTDSGSSLPALSELWRIHGENTNSKVAVIEAVFRDPDALCNFGQQENQQLLEWKRTCLAPLSDNLLGFSWSCWGPGVNVRTELNRDKESQLLFLSEEYSPPRLHNAPSPYSVEACAQDCRLSADQLSDKYFPFLTENAQLAFVWKKAIQSRSPLFALDIQEGNGSPESLRILPDWLLRPPELPPKENIVLVEQASVEWIPSAFCGTGRWQIEIIKAPVAGPFS